MNLEQEFLVLVSASEGKFAPVMNLSFHSFRSSYHFREVAAYKLFHVLCETAVKLHNFGAQLHFCRNGVPSAVELVFCGALLLKQLVDGQGQINLLRECLCQYLELEFDEGNFVWNLLNSCLELPLDLALCFQLTKSL